MKRFFVLCMILNYCIAYGMQEKQPSLLRFALQRAIEKDGYDVVRRKVDQREYTHSMKPGSERYPFFWSELIQRSDESNVAQHLWMTLASGPENSSGMVEEGVRFNSDGRLYAIVFDHKKEYVLNLLKEIKKSHGSICES